MQDAELAWHFFLPGLTSGYMYYGAVEDMPVKQTVAANAALLHAIAAIKRYNNNIIESHFTVIGPANATLPHMPSQQFVIHFTVIGHKCHSISCHRSKSPL